MSTQDRTSSDGSPSEGRQDATRQDPDPIDIDNDEEDLSEANDTTSISVCSTPPGLNDALGFDDLAVHDKPSQHATSVAEVNTQLTTRQVFVAGFDPPPSLQSRDQEELRQHIGSGAPPNDQLTSILQTARWKVDIAVNIFNLWHELGPPPNRSPNRAQSNGRQQPKSVSPTPSMINEMEAADIEEAKRKSAAEAAANSCDVRANDESASAIETDKEESRNGTFLVHLSPIRF